MAVRIIVCLGALVVLLAYCGHDRVEYFYFDFANGDVDHADWQEPKIWSYIGDEVPLKTKIDWNGETLQILNVKRCCIPFLDIRSPIPLSNMIIKTGEFVSDYHDLPGPNCVSIHREAENTMLLYWSYWPEASNEPSCIRIGDEISIELVPENGSEVLVVNAVLIRSGYYWISDF